ncbi:hypothetical protein GCM10011348_04630 [Marinobacterium nitratireducens]|uniref:ATPase domain-containing protein n=1 Tax=Marinobacterium nitratireducens TaxID=518897 RepID=A0A917Z873_9GAMM|nr:hypothetical protein [Marinobacterium nitratireducens]GGO76730.1 hypothetical protein GCM10011348_04630 [Marinobacterium nitratireducens]
MSVIDWHYPRRELAERYLQGVTQGIMNRIALLGVRRVGKTEFLLRDFCPLALEQGYLPIYANLWASPEHPHETIIEALKAALSGLKDRKRIKSVLASEVKKLEVGNSLIGKMGFEFNSPLPIIAPGVLTHVGQLLSQLVETPNCRPLLVIDEIQHLAESPAFHPLQGTLRTAFDLHGHKLPVVYAGSSRNGMQAMFADDKMPFYNSAYMVEFPAMGEELVRHCCDILRTRFELHYDVREITDVFTRQFDNSPFWLSKLIQHLVMNQCSVREAADLVQDQLVLDGGFEQLVQKLNATDRAVLTLIRERCNRLYAEDTLKLIKERFGLSVKVSGITASLKKLKRQRLISQMGRSDYLIENAGFVEYLRQRR